VAFYQILYRYYLGDGKKMAAMDCMGAQKYLRDYYAELASRRGNHARRISGQKNVQFAEAHQSQVPRVTNTIF
jgi:4-oxalomesaconate hydratase